MAEDNLKGLHLPTGIHPGMFTQPPAPVPAVIEDDGKLSGFSYPYGDSDRARLITDGQTVIISGKLLREIVSKVAPTLTEHELAKILRDKADIVWAQAGDDDGERARAADIHQVGACLRQCTPGKSSVERRQLLDRLLKRSKGQAA